jgi:hypothetical protein
MTMKRLTGTMLVLLGLAGWVPAAQAQDDGGLQILTSDLALENEVTSEKLVANFVIVSNSQVTSVVIDGEAQTVTPGDTVLVTKEFHFTKQRTVVTISATDKDGKTRERSYVVVFKGAAEEVKLVYGVTVKAAYEIDGNPTQDLSSPISIQGVSIKGVVKDSEQPDTRITLQAGGSLTYGKWTGFVGALSQTYAKSDNKDLNVQMLYLGGTGRFNLSGTRDFLVTYSFTDLNVGSNDYAQMHTISPAYESRSEDNKGFYKHTLAFDYTLKDFSSSTQTDGGQYALRWNYNSTNAAKRNTFDSIIAYGTSTEGDKDQLQDFDFLGANLDWVNRGESGLRFDIGFGLEYRSFKHDKQPLTKKLFGDTRVDTLWRLSTGLGYQFTPKWSAMFNYKYLTDISNKAPYVRPIYGVTVDGAF